MRPNRAAPPLPCAMETHSAAKGRPSLAAFLALSVCYNPDGTFCAHRWPHVQSCMLSHRRHKIASCSSCITRVFGGLEGAMHCPSSALHVGMRSCLYGDRRDTTCTSPPPTGGWCWSEAGWELHHYQFTGISARVRPFTYPPTALTRVCALRR